MKTFIYNTMCLYNGIIQIWHLKINAHNIQFAYAWTAYDDALTRFFQFSHKIRPTSVSSFPFEMNLKYRRNI